METILGWASYLKKKADRAFDDLTKELGDNRAILNWVYACAYLALIFYCVINNPLSHNTAIMTTGGIIGTIFSVYVLGGSYEKVQRMRCEAEHAADMTEEEQEEAAGD